MATSVRMLFLASVVAVVAAVATAGRALPAGQSCACALVDRGTVGRCMTLRPSSPGSSSGSCVGKNCEASFGCVDRSVATHTCQSRAMKAVPVCKRGGAAAYGATCACKMQATSETTLVPTQAITRGARSYTRCTPTTLPLHKVLSAKGRRLKLSDGRVVSASVKAVAGCKSLKGSEATGTAKGSLTRMSQGPSGKSCTLLRTRSGQEVFHKYQAIVVRVSGGKMVPSMTFEDVDVTTKPASQVKDGWRESMTALGLSDGKVVLPQMSTAPDAWTDVFSYFVTGSSLRALGWRDAKDAAIDGVAYKSRTHMENVKESNAFRARGKVEFTKPVDQMAVLYALNQPDKNDKKDTSAFVSAVRFGC